MRILRTLFIASMLITLVSHADSQHFIGKHKDEVELLMKESQKNFKLNTGVVNPHYKYLKYEDKINEMTLLFFLSEKDICTMTRQMCDYSNINDVETHLDQTYIKVDRNQWMYIVDGKEYSVKLVEEDWFFTVTTRLKDE